MSKLNFHNPESFYKWNDLILKIKFNQKPNPKFKRTKSTKCIKLTPMLIYIKYISYIK